MTMTIVESLRALYEKDPIDAEVKLDHLLTESLMNDLEGEDLDWMSAFYQLFTWKTAYKVDVHVTPQVDIDTLHGTIECADKKELFEKLDLEDKEVNKYDECIDFNSEEMFQEVRIDYVTPVVCVREFELR